MSASASKFQRISVVRTRSFPRPRKVGDVPFVELFGGKVQGVVSSGSDINRVYVAFFEAGTMNFNCSTNNNRPCGGLRGSPCKHLMQMLSEALVQCGVARVAKYLDIPGDISPTMGAHELVSKKRGTQAAAQVSSVFSRFLTYLRYVELNGSNAPVPEMAWFVTG